MSKILEYKDFLANIKKLLNDNLDEYIYEIRNFIDSQLIAKYIVDLTVNADNDNHVDNLNNAQHAMVATVKDNKIMEIAINELLINSIEHGLLALNYSLKSELLKNNQWDIYIDKKLKELPKHKCVKMYFRKTNAKEIHALPELQNYSSENLISIEVLDGGKGFNLNFLAERKKNIPSLERHGRGGMLIELGLPNLKYNELGNGATFYIAV